jgi:hypothetical protein
VTSKPTTKLIKYHILIFLNLSLVFDVTNAPQWGGIFVTSTCDISRVTDVPHRISATREVENPKRELREVPTKLAHFSSMRVVEKRAFYREF